MSTVKATHFEHPSASTAGITLAADGSVVLPQGFTGGVGSNVVQTVKTDTFTTTSGTFTPLTSFEVTITPSSATSKVLVTAQVAVGPESAQIGYLRLRRGGTAISGAVGDTAGSRTSATIAPFGNSSNDIYSLVVSYLDSPATTSPTTYDFDIRTISGSTVGINRAIIDTDTANIRRLISTLTVIEVAA